MNAIVVPGLMIHVRVPATSANLGPGFDCLALSLGLFNEVTAEVLPEGKSSSVAIDGEGAESLGKQDDNLVLDAMARFASSHGRELPAVHLHMHNGIPLGRGLGSSAAAIASGVMLAALLLGEKHGPAELLPIGLAMEGHPDNIVAALWGGFTLGVMDGDSAVVQRVVPSADLRAVLLIPGAASSTAVSRAALPAAVTRHDAVFSAGRVGLMVQAFGLDRRDLLRVAMDDRLHQPHRAHGFPYLMPAIDAAVQAGAHGASLSGAGSSVIALASDRFEQIEVAFARVAERHGLAARTCTIALDTQGSTCRLDGSPVTMCQR